MEAPAQGTRQHMHGIRPNPRTAFHKLHHMLLPARCRQSRRTRTLGQSRSATRPVLFVECDRSPRRYRSLGHVKRGGEKSSGSEDCLPLRGARARGTTRDHRLRCRLLPRSHWPVGDGTRLSGCCSGSWCGGSDGDGWWGGGGRSGIGSEPSRLFVEGFWRRPLHLWAAGRATAAQKRRVGRVCTQRGARARSADYIGYAQSGNCWLEPCGAYRRSW